MYLLLSAVLCAQTPTQTIEQFLGAERNVPAMVAHKALAGDYGELAAWQKDGYERLLKTGGEKRIAWITHYSQHEPGCNTTTASGTQVTEGRTAAMLDIPWPTKEHPERVWCYVLIDLPVGMTLRRIEDTGSRANRGRAQRKGAQTWVDIYRNTRNRNALLTTYIRPVWVVRPREKLARYNGGPRGPKRPRCRAYADKVLKKAKQIRGETT